MLIGHLCLKKKSLSQSCGWDLECSHFLLWATILGRLRILLYLMKFIVSSTSGNLFHSDLKCPYLRGKIENMSMRNIKRLDDHIKFLSMTPWGIWGYWETGIFQLGLKWSWPRNYFSHLCTRIVQAIIFLDKRTPAPLTPFCSLQLVKGSL